MYTTHECTWTLIHLIYVIMERLKIPYTCMYTQRVHNLKNIMVLLFIKTIKSPSIRKELEILCKVELQSFINIIILPGIKRKNRQ